MLPANRREDEHKGYEGEAVLKHELSECAVIRLSPERIHGEGEGGGGGVALLRSRVEQQSTLIAMLKQRGDETFREASIAMSWDGAQGLASPDQLELYKRSYEDALAKKQVLDVRLQEEERKTALVERRFNALAENHEQMIKIKDEYKCTNQTLIAENERLKHENKVKFSAAVEEREVQLSCLRKELETKCLRETQMEECCSRLEARVAEAEERLRALQEKSAKETERLEARLSAALQAGQELRRSLESREEDVTRLKSDVQHLEEHCRQREHEMKGVQDKLDYEKDLYDLPLMMNEVTECLVSELRSSLAQADQETQRLREDFRGRAEEVLRDSQVMRLRRELLEAQDRKESLEREFSAYKKHTSELLKQERELNSKLRHLLE